MGRRIRLHSLPLGQPKTPKCSPYFYEIRRGIISKPDRLYSDGLPDLSQRCPPLTPQSCWIIPGLLAIGLHPTPHLAQLIDNGISTFVDLRDSDEKSHEAKCSYRKMAQKCLKERIQTHFDREVDRLARERCPCYKRPHPDTGQRQWVWIRKTAKFLHRSTGTYFYRTRFDLARRPLPSRTTRYTPGYTTPPIDYVSLPMAPGACPPAMAPGQKVPLLTQARRLAGRIGMFRHVLYLHAGPRDSFVRPLALAVLVVGALYPELTPDGFLATLRRALAPLRTQGGDDALRALAVEANQVYFHASLAHLAEHGPDPFHGTDRHYQAHWMFDAPWNQRRPRLEAPEEALPGELSEREAVQRAVEERAKRHPHESPEERERKARHSLRWEDRDNRHTRRTNQMLRIGKFPRSIRARLEEPRGYRWGGPVPWFTQNITREEILELAPWGMDK
eukprot:gnl/Trimastix_PCT/3392.p1 GENE.gnl/Trimastix_PCT/3392~~gnl/Trimastix_PCT/3392.p1  ORF type:complete len:447 (+),score=55.53 gnl/Trimastix_PCT/3392:78-1418(+)